MLHPNSGSKIGTLPPSPISTGCNNPRIESAHPTENSVNIKDTLTYVQGYFGHYCTVLKIASANHKKLHKEHDFLYT
jgi:hypothetical protein